MPTSLVPDHIQGRNPHYVNHDRELAEAGAEIAAAEGNLVIVFSGAPGSGKTATARELAFRVKHRFPDGALFADLRGALDRQGAEAEVLRTFLAELGEDVANRMAVRGRRFDQAEGLVALGDVRSATGDTAGARDSWREALSCYEDLGFSGRAEEVRGRLSR
ncbi:hypothetical protein [Amycolatopsis sp.]|uniref:hypothetical protein n=1 Tax=Amycolatopsis sp. TaxID=37632 RepID=UPI002D80B9D4|nr:hypothetical protein [Amycolatopsis sp.]HET6708821.1 hypothetical protein [Amycolatopsis sp.]